MSEYINEHDEKFIGEVLPGQGWVELRGIFTIQELEVLMKKIWSNYKEADNDDPQRHNDILGT